MYFKQRTFREPAETVGIGLHSGRKVRLTLRPAEPGTGIVFRRVDQKPVVEIPSNPLSVNDTRMATTLNVGRVQVATVEHLMSALNGYGIDNAYVDVDAPEIPIMDGSGASFSFLMQQGGSSSRTLRSASFASKRPSGSRKATSGLRSLRTTASSSPSKSISVTPRSTRRRSAPKWTSRTTPMRRPSPARAPSVSFRTWKCCAAWGSLRAEAS